MRSRSRAEEACDKLIGRLRQGVQQSAQPRARQLRAVPADPPPNYLDRVKLFHRQVSLTPPFDHTRESMLAFVEKQSRPEPPSNSSRPLIRDSRSQKSIKLGFSCTSEDPQLFRSDRPHVNLSQFLPQQHDRFKDQFKSRFSVPPPQVSLHFETQEYHDPFLKRLDSVILAVKSLLDD